jgi:predicted O-methyltransferase YrrM
MKSSDGLSPKRKAVWNIVRHVVPKRLRWYYEGHPAMRGQLWFAERKLLYCTIRKWRPGVCFEIGTWKGGGSTLFIAQGLRDNGFGKLHTIETNDEFYEESRANYERLLPHLFAHVVFHRGDYRDVYSGILREIGSLDFLFLDGAEDAEETLQQYQFFQPFMKAGSVLMAHDWFTAKCALLRPKVEQPGHWNIVSVLTPPRSVGLVLAVRSNG